MRALKLTLALFFSFFFSSAFAIESPVDMLNKTIVKVQNELSQNKELQSMSTEELYTYLKDTLMPYLAIKQMSAMTVGPLWRSATEAQRDHFVDEFGMMLTRTYASALLKVSDVKVTVRPLHDQDWQSKKRVMVQGSVARDQAQESSQVNYYLKRTKKDTWLVYDVAVEGVSFIKNYNEQFASFKTMDELLAKLDEINHAKEGAADSAE